MYVEEEKRRLLKLWEGTLRCDTHCPTLTLRKVTWVARERSPNFQKPCLNSLQLITFLFQTLTLA